MTEKIPPLRIVIIGAAAAGLSAASKARQIDRKATITVFEQSSLIAFEAFALPCYIGDCFTRAEDMSELTPEEFAAKGIDVRVNHQVQHVDPQKQIVHVENLTTGEILQQHYDRLLIATGAVPAPPSVPGIDEGLETGRIFFVKTMQDGLMLKDAVNSELIQDIAIIGASYIGLNMVEALQRQGKRVRIFDKVAQPLSASFDREIAELLTTQMEANDIACHWLEPVQQVSEGEDGRLHLITDKGRYQADLAILCTKALPNTSFLQDSGLEMLDNGAIVVDDKARTNITNIFAAGDCATVNHASLGKPTWVPLITVATKLGRLAGDTMLGLDKRFSGSYHTLCLKVMDIEAGRVGLSEQDAKDHNIDYRTVVINDKDHIRYSPGQSDILVKLVYEPDSKKLLGGQVAGGRGAVLRVNTLAAAIQGSLTTEDLSMMDFCFSPPFSLPWDALNVAGSAAK